MEKLSRLLAIDEIKQLKARYFRCMDTHDWVGFGEIFTGDVVVDVRGAVGPLRSEAELTSEAVIVGRDAFVAHARDGLSMMTSVHRGFMPEIHVVDDRHATGIWAMSDLLRPVAGSPFSEFRGYGHYTETYRRDDETWRIASLKLRRLHVEILQ